jgi:hypothetical protein
MSLLLFDRAFYPNLVRAALAGNAATMAGSFLTRFSQKAWLLFRSGVVAFGRWVMSFSILVGFSL